MRAHRFARRAGAPALLICSAALAFGGRVPAAQDKPEAVVAGQKMRIESKILGETREAWIALPQGYEETKDGFPVIVQLGGAVHFRYSAAIADLLGQNGHIPASIVAALIDPTPRHHYRDTTPTKVGYLPASGGAGLFLRFLKEEFLPALDARFRTRPFRILCGHGLSGLFAVQTLIDSPGTFGAVITDGASLTFDDSVLLKRIEALPEETPVRGVLYLGVGNELETIPGHRTLAGHLGRSAFRGLNWTLQIEPDEDQGTASLPVFYKGLKWIYRDWRLPMDIAARGMSAVRAYFADLSSRFGYEIPVTVKTLAARGFQMIREQRFDDAAALFKLNAEAYPEFPEVYQNLGFLYERTRRFEPAAECYDKAAEKAAASDPGLAKFLRAQAEQARSRAKSAK